MSYLIRQAAPQVMNLFHRYVPIRKHTLVEGFGVRGQVGVFCREHGYRRVLIVTDETLIKLGHLDKVIDSLEEQDISYRIYDKILPNPNFSMVENGTALGLRQDAQCIIALGGGSVMDTAKIIAGYMKAPDRDVRFIATAFYATFLNKAVPVVTIPTTAGTGAEVTLGSVISDDVTHTKYTGVTLYSRIQRVYLDAELTVGCPPAITAATGFDALSHGIEGYLSAVTPTEERAEASLACVKTVMENLRTAYHDGGNVEARQAMARGAYYGGLSINYESLGYGHSFGHTIGAWYDVPHGQALSIALPPVLRYHREELKDRLADLARVCALGDPEDSVDTLADRFLEEVDALIEELGLPTTLPAIRAEDYPDMIANVMRDSFLWAVPKAMTYREAERLLDMMSGGACAVAETSRAREKMSSNERALRAGILTGTATFAALGLTRGKSLGCKVLHCLPLAATAAFHGAEAIVNARANRRAK